MTSYTDADSNTATTTYDLSGRVATTDDGKGTRTYTYDGGSEKRGLATSVVDSQVGTFSSGIYDADGTLTSQTWPNGVGVTTTYDETGAASGLTYTMTGCGQADCTLYDESVQQSTHGQQRNHASTLSSQTYTYDNAGRLLNTTETVDGQCTTRVYAFNLASDRTSLATYAPAADGGCQVSTGTTVNVSYDTADRLAGNGYVYDSLGRTSTAPANATGIPVGGDLTATYYVTDYIRSLSQAGRTTTYDLDVLSSRVRSWTDSDGSTTTSRTHHYADDSDSPTWTDESGGIASRVVRSLDGMAAITAADVADSVMWQINNLHNDVVGSIDNASMLPSSFGESTEYGQPRNADEVGSRRYGWLGAEQRAADTPSGAMLMGRRVYLPATGRFLSTDPVFGGSANSYDYSNQDPVNMVDLDGQRARRSPGAGSCGALSLVRKHALARSMAEKCMKFVRNPDPVWIYRTRKWMVGCGKIFLVGGASATGGNLITNIFRNWAGKKLISLYGGWYGLVGSLLWACVGATWSGSLKW